MLVYTLKNVLKCFQEYATRNKYVLVASGVNTRYNYRFTIKSGSLIMNLGNEDGTDIRCHIDDVELFPFKDNLFKLISLEEVSYRDNGAVYETNNINVAYEAQVFLKLFRIMGESLMFTFVHNGKYYDCYSIDGKVFYVEETEKEYNLMGTDLYRLGSTHRKYSIVTISALPTRLTYSKFIEMQNYNAQKLGKKLVKYKKGMLSVDMGKR